MTDGASTTTVSATTATSKDAKLVTSATTASEVVTTEVISIGSGGVTVISLGISLSQISGSGGTSDRPSHIWNDSHRPAGNSRDPITAVGDLQIPHPVGREQSCISVIQFQSDQTIGLWCFHSRSELYCQRCRRRSGWPDLGLGSVSGQIER